MKTTTLLLLALGLLACSKKEAVESVRPDPNARTGQEWRDELVDFSVRTGAMASQSDSGAPAVMQPPPRPPRGLKRTSRKRVLAPAKKKEPDFELPAPPPPQALGRGDRPFTPDEIARYILERFTRARTLLPQKNPEALRLIEEAQTYTRDGSFHLLRAEWDLAAGDPEAAVVQAEQALRRPFILDPEGPKRASLLICRALDAIKAARPSDAAQERSAAAWLKYNLTYSP